MRFVIENGYPSMMLFKADEKNSSAYVYLGPHDLDSLVAFVDVKTDRIPAPAKVQKMYGRNFIS